MIYDLITWPKFKCDYFVKSRDEDPDPVIFGLPDPDP